MLQIHIWLTQLPAKSESRFVAAENAPPVAATVSGAKTRVVLRTSAERNVNLLTTQFSTERTDSIKTINTGGFNYGFANSSEQWVNHGAYGHHYILCRLPFTSVCFLFLSLYFWQQNKVIPSF